MSVCPHLQEEHPAAYLLVQACQHLWPVLDYEVYRRFTCVNRAIEPCPRSALVLADPDSTSRFPPGSRRGTLFRQLHTPPLPVTHVPLTAQQVRCLTSFQTIKITTSRRTAELKNFDEGEDALQFARFERPASMDAALLRDRGDFLFAPVLPRQVFRSSKL
jgi:hypothetical protein